VVPLIYKAARGEGRGAGGGGGGGPGRGAGGGGGMLKVFMATKIGKKARQAGPEPLAKENRAFESQITLPQAGKNRGKGLRGDRPAKRGYGVDMTNGHRRMEQKNPGTAYQSLTKDRTHLGCAGDDRRNQDTIGGLNPQQMMCWRSGGGISDGICPR